MNREAVIRTTKVAAQFEINGPALYHEPDCGRRQVIIASDEMQDDQMRPYRVCGFVDEMGKQYEVEVAALEPCDEDFRPLTDQPAHLKSPRGRALPTTNTPGGLVYAPEPFYRRPVIHPPKVQQILARYDRSDAQPPEDVAINRSLLTADQLLRLEQAEADMALEGRQNAAKRRAGRGKMMELQRELSDLHVELEIAQGNVATIKTAIARKEEVELKDRKIRMKSRDGLWSLYQLKKLTPEQYWEGMEFRAGVEARVSDVGSQMGNEGPGAGHRHEQFVAARAERAFLVERIARVERAVAMQSISYPSALQMLRWVAGEGHSISAWGKGWTYAKNLKALVFALDLALKVPRRKPEDPPEQTKAAR